VAPTPIIDFSATVLGEWQMRAALSTESSPPRTAFLRGVVGSFGVPRLVR